MAFLPNNNNYRNYNNMFNTQSFEPLNNFPFIQPMTPIINNQIMANPILPAQNIPTTNLRRNKSFIAPMTYGNNMLGYSPNNIYLNQPNIYLDQNLNYRMPGNNVYSPMTLNRIPLYSNLTARNGIVDANYLGEMAYYNKNTKVFPSIRFQGYPHKLYSSSLKPNNYMFRRIRNPKELEMIEKERNLKINKTLEEMCIYGNGMGERIKEEKKNYPDKYIPTKEALKQENKDPELFALGLVASIAEQYNIETAIKNDKYVEKGTMEGKTMPEIQTERSKKVKEEKLSFQLISNGWIGKNKYDLYFDMDKERFTKIMYNPVENHKFKETIKEKMEKDYKAPKDKTIVNIPSINHVQVIFQSQEFNDLDLEEFKNKFKNDPNYPELATIKEIQKSLIMDGCILSKDQLDCRGNRIQWPKDGERGGKPYDPPKGWIGIGLKAFDEYENDRWLDMYNLEGEWIVAYHGVGHFLPSSEVNRITGEIYKKGFKAGGGQIHKECDDYFHPGKKVGEGVYCTPLIRVAEFYAGNSEFNGKKYKTVIMCRVKPDVIRHCNTCEASRDNKFWVVNGSTDEIRPYRILYKKV